MIEIMVNELLLKYGLLGLGWVLYFWERYARSKEQERFQKLAANTQAVFQNLVAKMVITKNSDDERS